MQFEPRERDKKASVDLMISHLYSYEFYSVNNSVTA